jgi:hypothetical protein
MSFLANARNDNAIRIRPATPDWMKSRIMYIECKSAETSEPARIGRVAFSKTGKTLYYRGRTFQSLKGAGFKSNFYCQHGRGVLDLRAS